MAKNLGEEVDPAAITREDEMYGGVIANMSRSGRVHLQRVGRRRQGAYRTEDERLMLGQMKADMAALWAAGANYEEIAERVNRKFELDRDNQIGKHNIHYHLKQIKEYWREKALAKIDERQAMILARFEQIEALAVEGYFASLEGRRTHTYNKQITKARSKEREAQLMRKEEKRRKKAERDRKRLRPLFATPIADGEDLYKPDNLLEEIERRINTIERMEENRAGDPKFLAIMVQINRERAKIFQLYSKREESSQDHDAARLSDEQREERLGTLLTAAKERRQGQVSMLAEPAPLGGFEVPPLEINVDPDPIDEDSLDDMTFDEVEDTTEDDTQWD